MWFVVHQLVGQAYALSGPFRRRETAEKAAVGSLSTDRFTSAKVVRAAGAWQIAGQETGSTLVRELAKLGVKKPAQRKPAAPPVETGAGQ